MSTPQKPFKAVLYTRISTGGQEQNTSLAAQFAACSARARELGAEVTAHYEETQSGGLYLSRPGIQKALQDIEEKRADALIVYKLDRSGRDAGDLRDIRKRIHRAGGQFIFADGMQFENNAVGNLMFTQMSAYAEFERELIRERTSNGSRNRAKSGIMPTRARRPYGYRFVTLSDVEKGTHGRDEIGQYLIVEDEAHWVRAIFERYARGDSLMDICRMLHDSAVPTMRGGLCWRGCTVHNILKNPIYKGRPAYGKRAFLVDEKRMQNGVNVKYSAPRKPDEWISFDAPAIVSPELFDRVQNRLHSAQGFHSGPKTGRRLLSGLVRCKQCGRVMQFNAAKIGKRPRPNRTVGYYRCFHPLDPVRCESQLRFHNANRLHGTVTHAVATLFEDEVLLQSAAAEYEKARAERAARLPETNWKRLEGERRKLQARVSATVEAEISALSSGRDALPYRQKLNELDAQIKALDARLAARDTGAARPAEKETRGWRGMAQMVVQTLHSETVAEHEKNKVLSGLLHHVTSDENGVEVYFREHGGGLIYHAHCKADKIKVTVEPSTVLETSLPPRRKPGSPAA